MSAQILIVEDTPHTLDLMVYLLESRGHWVMTASNGDGAVALAREHELDLVIMDIQLVGSIDGFEAMRRIRSLPGRGTLPTLAVTAFAMVGDREHALRAGFSDYLTKPIDPYTFGPDIERHLPPDKRGRLIPRAVPAASPAAVAPPEQAPGHPRVLLVDDEPTNRELLRSIFEPFGFQVSCVGTIDQALERIREHRPDVVLSDIHLGPESGITLWRRLQDDPDLAHIPFAFTTATGALLSELPATVEVIHRPVEPRLLLTKVHELITAPEQARARSNSARHR